MKKWSNGITIFLSAAHFLPKYDGNCKNVHGHTWKVCLIISGDKLDDQGFIVDFRDFHDKIAKKVKDEFDHTLINNHPYFKDTESIQQPTSELIAAFIYRMVDVELTLLRPRIKLESVTVWENEHNFSSYNEE
jgi:6-pyruvoyltetrahydropterin/6-carboxytetrahydropterin synthase